MGKAAARKDDKVKQTNPHCHSPHPPSPPPGPPTPHPPKKLKITGPCAAKVKIGNKAAARSTDQTEPCASPKNGCLAPGGPGVIAMGSTSVLIETMPAARLGDPTAHAACVAPIPAPAGKIVSGFRKVQIG